MAADGAPAAAAAFLPDAPWFEETDAVTHALGGEPLEVEVLEGHRIRPVRAAGDHEPQRITWHDELQDPTYQFIRLVAGFTNEPVDTYLDDDSRAVDHLRIIRTIRTLRDLQGRWEKRAERLRRIGRATVPDAPRGTRLERTGDDDTWIPPEEGVACVLLPPRAQADWEPALEAAFHGPQVTQVSPETGALVPNLRRALEQWQARMQDKARAVQRDLVRIRAAGQREMGRTNPRHRYDAHENERGIAALDRRRTGSHSHGIYVSSELLLKPIFHSAVTLAFSKVAGRCRHHTNVLRNSPADSPVTLDNHPLRRLMRDAPFQPVFAYLVSRQILITRVNNPKTVYKKVVDYRRLVAQENAAFVRLNALMRAPEGQVGAPASLPPDTLFGYDSVTQPTTLF